jgi:hypothetical protein
MSNAGFALFILALAASILPGCSDPNRGLVRTMDEYAFTAMSPPQTSWVVGSVIEVKEPHPNSPTLFSAPSREAIDAVAVTRHAPDVSRNHADRLRLSAGIGLPAEIRTEAEARGATWYSVMADGNFIQAVPIDSYAADIFPALSRRNLPVHWQVAIERGTLFYVSELWFAKSLEYRFYTDGGSQVRGAAPIPDTPAVGTLASEFSWRDDGALVYHGPKPLCLGYKRRAIQLLPDPTSGRSEPYPTMPAR